MRMHLIQPAAQPGTGLAVLALLTVFSARGAMASLPGTFAVRADSVATREDAAVVFDPLENDSGPVDPATVSIVIPPQRGSATVDPANGQIRYVPAKGLSGQDTLTYSVCDTSLASCPSATVAIQVAMWGDYRVVYNRVYDGGGIDAFDFWTDNTQGSDESPLTSTGGQECALSPNRRQIACGLTVFDVDNPANDIDINVPGTIGLFGPMRSPSWSPGGDNVVFQAGDSIGGATLFTYRVPLRSGSVDPLGQSDLAALTYQEGNATLPSTCYNPFWGPSGILCDTFGLDPQGRRGIFRVGGGSKPALVFEDDKATQPCEGPDGRIVYRTWIGYYDSAIAVRSAGGTSQIIKVFGETWPAAGEGIMWPRWSPDGRKIVVVRLGTGTSQRLVIVSDDGSDTMVFWPDVVRLNGGYLRNPGWDPAPVPAPPVPTRAGGRLLVVRTYESGEPGYGPGGGRHYPWRAAANGGGASDVLAHAPTYSFNINGVYVTGCRKARWAPDGSRVACVPEVTFAPGFGSAILVVNADGTQPSVITPFPGYSTITDLDWSPDGTRLAVAAIPADGLNRSRLYRMNIDGSAVTLIADLGAPGGVTNHVNTPAWSPDGSFIAFVGPGDFPPFTRYVVPADGSGSPVAIASGPQELADRASWSPGGTRLAFSRSVTEYPAGSRIHVADFVPTPAPHLDNIRRLTHRLGIEAHPSWSPDGQSLAFIKRLVDPGHATSADAVWMANENGRLEMQVLAVPAATDVALADWTGLCAVPAAEICDGLDNDCDGVIDDGFVLGGPCTEGVGACERPGFTVCDAGGAGIQCSAVPGTPFPEACDGADNDCDGLVDEGLVVTVYRDQDGDGYGDAGSPLVACAPPPAGYVGDATDCDDTAAATYPGAPEINDGLDNGCPGDPGDGLVDEIGGPVGFTNPANLNEICWPAQPGATSYQLVRSADPGFASGTCVVWVLTATCYDDGTAPPQGAGYFYLLRPLTPFAGSWGRDGQGVERIGVCGLP